MAQAEDKCFAYRQSRKAFIAACSQAGADVIGRVHPKRGPDGKPLFLDAAAFGPRLAPSGVLVVAGGSAGGNVLLALLSDKTQTRLPEGVRLVLVHSADPVGFAWNDPELADPTWGAAMLRSVVAEDFRKAKRLTVVRLGWMAPELEALGSLAISTLALEPGGQAKKAVQIAIAAAG